MLKTNVYNEIKKVCLDENTNVSNALVNAGMHSQYTQRMKNGVVWFPESMIKLMESLGYDVEIKFVKRSAPSAVSADDDIERLDD